jgi:RNA polymerase sigma-70 factor (ECF subfamily)
MSGETFEALLQSNLRFVRTLVRRHIPASAVVEDVVQDILLRAFSNRHQLRDEAKFRTWLWSIVLNEIRQHFRRERRVLSIDDFPGFDISDPATSPLARLEQRETRDWVHSCVAKLSDRDRKAIRLRDLEERTMQEAAAALDSSVGAAKTMHFRARQRLAHILRVDARRRVPIRAVA